MSRAAVSGSDLVEAFRRTVSTFDGSVAIAAASAAAPGQVLLALRGSGQGLYVGLAEDLTIVASEPYGLVEVTDTYLRMDGERPAHADQPLSQGQVVALTAGERRRARRHRPHSPTTARRCPCARTSSYGPRSRPGTSTAATRRTSC